MSPCDETVHHRLHLRGYDDVTHLVCYNRDALQFLRSENDVFELVRSKEIVHHRDKGDDDNVDELVAVPVPSGDDATSPTETNDGMPPA